MDEVGGVYRQVPQLNPGEADSGGSPHCLYPFIRDLILMLQMSSLEDILFELKLYFLGHKHKYPCREITPLSVNMLVTS